MNNIVFRNCPYCSHNNAIKAPTCFGNEIWEIKACASCNFVYIETVPVYESLSEDFAWEKTSVAEKARKAFRDPIKYFISEQLKFFRRSILKRNKLPQLIQKYFTKGNVLDIGCAGGVLLANLDQIYTPHGIEISKNLAQKANKQVKLRGGYVVHNDALSGLKKLPSNYFSGVILSAFLEHEINPKEVLREIYRTLSPSGSCIIKVPNFASINRLVRGKKWCGFRLPDHVNYFTPANLVGMCLGAGFHIRQFKFLDRLPISDNMWIIIQKLK
jgi:2-polyprenyl-3-methyl-5-hydroxy-6-metoxy-1,4-benzoquinol methylase